MYKLPLLNCLIAILCLIGGLSCSSNSNETPTPAGGTLSGSVQLWDDKLTTSTDNSGVTITVNDLTNTSATTDAAGKYTFATLPYGLHDFTVSKAGYGSYKLFGVSHNSASISSSSISGTVVPAIQFGKLSTTSITSLSVSGNTYNGNPGVSVLYSVSPTPTSVNRGYARYFLSTDQGVSNTNYKYASPIVSVLNNNVTGGFTKDDLLTAGFKSGQPVYLRLYGESVQSNTYTDPNIGIQAFPNLNLTTPSAVSFVMP